MRVLRIQAKRSCRVLVMLGLAAAKKEGRERERERERESDFGRRSYFWIPLLFALLLTDSVMPALPARQDLLSQGVQVYKSQTRPQSPTGSWFLVIQAGSPLPPSLREPYQVPNTHTIILVPSSSASMCRGAHRRAAKWQLEKQRALPPFLPSSTRFKILSPRVKKAHSPPIVASIGLGLWLNSMSAGELQWNSVNCSSSIIGFFFLLEYSSTYQDQKHLDLKDPLM